MAEGILKDRLLSGEVVHGLLSPNIEPNLVETLGLLGFDLYILDAEHGTAGPVEAAARVRRGRSRAAREAARPRPEADPAVPRRRNDGDHASRSAERRRRAAARGSREVSAGRPPRSRGDAREQ